MHLILAVPVAIIFVSMSIGETGPLPLVAALLGLYSRCWRHRCNQRGARRQVRSSFNFELWIVTASRRIARFCLPGWQCNFCRYGPTPISISGVHLGCGTWLCSTYSLLVLVSLADVLSDSFIHRRKACTIPFARGSFSIRLTAQ